MATRASTEAFSLTSSKLELIMAISMFNRSTTLSST
eukprot:CAMPEP_0205909656 /NCGR_PEP_ID=MMETSP1325-20131115/4018_1 /ASSEMBLY_ACC=CAM_ASM_000708 /TAXON_ID=236786 /ORGANISM="Florenciella sp., Strain RCC1007" /LENGTH=35 /DNA_ID= /DNA_START= /DNA_END= /DNA_ORIENTATION=